MLTFAPILFTQDKLSKKIIYIKFFMRTLSKLSLITILVIISSAMNAQSLPFSFGVKGGINLSNFSGNSSEGGKARIGYNAGVMVDYRINSNLYVMSGLEVTEKGAKREGMLSLGNLSLDGNIKMNALYLQLPLHVGYKMPLIGSTNVVIHAGPYLAYGIGGKTKMKGTGYAGEASMGIDTESDFFSDTGHKHFDFGVGMGANVEFGKLLTGIGYDFGLLNISQNSEMTLRNMNAYLFLGYKF